MSEGLGFDGKSTQTVGGVDSSFYFAPQKGVSQQTILIYTAVAVVIYLVVSRRRN